MRLWRRYVAPAAFLLAVTIAVVLVRSGLRSGGSDGAVTTGGPPPPGVTTSPVSTVRRFYVVRPGDTLAVISSRTGVAVSRLRKLNPKVTSTSLHVGERIRIR